MATVYAVANQKGGVGKTTTAVNMAACVAEAGYRTLLVDLDPQCNATVALAIAKDLEPNTYTCLLGDDELPAAARPTGIASLAIVPSRRTLPARRSSFPVSRPRSSVFARRSGRCIRSSITSCSTVHRRSGRCR
jgi:chromosome partitioning protein